MINTKQARESYLNALVALDNNDKATIKFLMMTVALLLDAIDADNDYKTEYEKFRAPGGLR